MWLDRSGYTYQLFPWPADGFGKLFHLFRSSASPFLKCKSRSRKKKHLFPRVVMSIEWKRQQQYASPTGCLATSVHCDSVSDLPHPCLSLILFDAYTNRLAQQCRGQDYSGLDTKIFSWKEPPSVQFSSVAQSCPTLCDPMNRSMPGLPVHHKLPEFTQTHAYRVGDAIQPSHPLSSPSPPAPHPSQHQSAIPKLCCGLHLSLVESGLEFCGCRESGCRS